MMGNFFMKVSIKIGMLSNYQRLGDGIIECGFISVNQKRMFFSRNVCE